MRCNEQMGSAGSVAACPAVHGWHDPGLFCQPVMLLAWETPMSRGHMCQGLGSMVLFFHDHCAIYTSGKTEISHCAVGAQTIG